MFTIRILITFIQVDTDTLLRVGLQHLSKRRRTRSADTLAAQPVVLFARGVARGARVVRDLASRSRGPWLF